MTPLVATGTSSSSSTTTSLRRREGRREDEDFDVGGKTRKHGASEPGGEWSRRRRRFMEARHRATTTSERGRDDATTRTRRNNKRIRRACFVCLVLLLSLSMLLVVVTLLLDHGHQRVLRGGTKFSASSTLSVKGVLATSRSHRHQVRRGITKKGSPSTITETAEAATDGVAANSSSSSTSQSQACLDSPTYSMHQMGIDLLQYSSRKNRTLPYEKLRRILLEWPRSRRKRKGFEMDLGEDWVFGAVQKNLVAMLESIGLRHHISNNTFSNTTDGLDNSMLSLLQVEGSYNGMRKYRQLVFEQGLLASIKAGRTKKGQKPMSDAESPVRKRWRRQPRIIIQSEQLTAKSGELGREFLWYFQDCHASPLCMVWDYTTVHYSWFEEKGLTDSVLLFPIMHQTRLYESYIVGSTVWREKEHDEKDRLGTKPLQERDIDVVFFGAMTPRRQHLKNSLMRWVSEEQLKRGKRRLVEIDFRHDLQRQLLSYANAKVCILPHSYDSGGNALELHRLVEMAGLGCLPLVEHYEDEYVVHIGLDCASGLGHQTTKTDLYQQCGGILVSQNVSEMADLAIRLVEEIDKNSKKDEHTPVLENQEVHSQFGDHVLASNRSIHTEWWNRGIQWDRLLFSILNDDDLSKLKSSN